MTEVLKALDDTKIQKNLIIDMQQTINVSIILKCPNLFVPKTALEGELWEIFIN